MTSARISFIPREKQAIALLSTIMGVRMLGLFMVLPVLTLYADTFPAATSGLIGLSVGVYGLTQALFQLPYGLLSDRFGRKPLIFIGLSLLIVGSLIAANATSIYMLILGRALQGSGAVGATLMACLSDITRPAIRTQAMGIMGASIGISFMVAFILGPLLYSWSQLAGIFYTTAAMAGLSLYLASRLPEAPLLTYWSAWAASLKEVVKNRNLWRLFFSVMTLHALLAAIFLFIPKKLSVITTIQPVWIYCVTLGLAFGLVVPALRSIDKHGTRTIFLSLIGVFGVCISALIMQNSFILFALALSVFFAVFCLYEAWLPALVSKLSPEASRGATLGVFSTCQFFGIFIGGALGGQVIERFGLAGLQISCIALIVSWLVVCLRFKFP